MLVIKERLTLFPKIKSHYEELRVKIFNGNMKTSDIYNSENAMKVITIIHKNSHCLLPALNSSQLISISIYRNNYLFIP